MSFHIAAPNKWQVHLLPLITHMNKWQATYSPNAPPHLVAVAAVSATERSGVLGFLLVVLAPIVALLRLTTPLASIVLPRLGILFFIRVTIVILVLLALSAMLFLSFFSFYLYVVSFSSWYAPFALPYFPPRPLREFLEFRIGSCVKTLP